MRFQEQSLLTVGRGVQNTACVHTILAGILELRVFSPSYCQGHCFLPLPCVILNIYLNMPVLNNNEPNKKFINETMGLNEYFNNNMVENISLYVCQRKTV